MVSCIRACATGDVFAGFAERNADNTTASASNPNLFNTQNYGDGTTGANGATGLTGAAGAHGNFPVQANWPAALAAYASTAERGLGVVWAQSSSGQVWQITAQKLAQGSLQNETEN